MSANLKTWAHWVLAEYPPADADRRQMAVDVTALVKRLERLEAVLEASRKLRNEMHGVSQWAEIIARDIGWTNWNILMAATDAVGEAISACDEKARSADADRRDP